MNTTNPVTMSRTVPLWLVVSATVCLAAIVGWLDFHADEVQGTVLLLLIFTSMLSFAAPRAAWVIALIMGLSVETTYLIARGMGLSPAAPMSPPAGGLIALIPSAIGAAVGVALRKGFSELTAR